MEGCSIFSDFLERKGVFQKMKLNGKRWSFKFVLQFVQESGIVFNRSFNKLVLLVKYQRYMHC